VEETRRGIPAISVSLSPIVRLVFYLCDYRGQKASNDADHRYGEHASVSGVSPIPRFTSCPSRGVLWLPGFYITMSVVRMLRPVVLHTLWKRSSFRLMQMIHITEYFLLTFEFKFQTHLVYCNELFI
jgi:hypothetical protein